MRVSTTSQLAWLILASLLQSSYVLWGQNLLPNPGFEQGMLGSPPTGWGWYGTKTGDNPHSGSYCARQTNSYGNSWNVFLSSSPITINPTNRYKLSVWSRNTFPTCLLQFGVRYISGASTIRYCWGKIPANTNTWQEYTFGFQPDKNATAVAIYFWVGMDARQGEVYWDDISLAVNNLTNEVTKYMAVSELQETVLYKDESNTLNTITYDPAAPGQWRMITPEEIHADIQFNAKTSHADWILRAQMFKTYDKNTIIWNQAQVVNEGQIYMSVPLYIEELDLGRYTVSIELYQGSGILEKVEKDIIIRPDPASSPEWSW